MPDLSLDLLLFGGGIAGLWLLDDFRRAGYRALLLESASLGSSQTIACQGIIHGGLKYMFDGRLTPSASAIRDMPPLWRECLAGTREPNLATTRILSDGCCIWGTGSIKSRIFLAGSALALRAAPRPLDRADWPAALAGAPGKVLFVPEQVIEPASLVAALAARNSGHIARIDPARTEFIREGGRLRVRIAAGPTELILSPSRIVFSAGEGNADLRRRAGLDPAAMQVRPLHMVMARGPLPPLFGHCVGGSKPRLTVTTATDRAGLTVWQLGGLIAEEGVGMDVPKLIEFARGELPACIPGLDLSGVELAAYRVNRAEAANPAGQRPDDVHVVVDGGIITAWPTKLALAPRLAERVRELLPAPAAGGDGLPANLPAPPIADPPWEGAVQWFPAR